MSTGAKRETKADATAPAPPPQPAIDHAAEIERAETQAVLGVEAARARQALAADPDAATKARSAADALEEGRRGRRGYGEHVEYPMARYREAAEALHLARARADLMEALAAGKAPTWPSAAEMERSAAEDLVRDFVKDTGRPGLRWLLSKFGSSITEDLDELAHPRMDHGGAQGQARRATLESRIATRQAARDGFADAFAARIGAVVKAMFPDPDGLVVSIHESRVHLGQLDAPDPAIAGLEAELAEVNERAGMLARDAVAVKYGGGLLFKDLQARKADIEGRLAPLRAADAARAEGAARGLAETLLAGNPHAWDSVLDLASKVPNAYPEGFAASLVAAAGEALADSDPVQFARAIEAHTRGGNGLYREWS